MTDFGSAFDEGQRAAENAESARNEVDLVFEKVNRQVAAKTGRKLYIERKERKRARPLAEILTWPPKGLQTYWAIVATNPTVEGAPSKEIARWLQDRRGYPCRILWEGEDRSCEDRDALERNLADLLKDPLVAQVLYTLMKLEPKVEDNADAQ
jgi:hypothetical protein